MLLLHLLLHLLRLLLRLRSVHFLQPLLRLLPHS
jgi:hypothetical protein